MIVIMKKISLLISALVLVSCIEESVPDGSTVIEQPDVPALLNGLPADMTAAGVSGFYATYGFHVDFGIPSIHIMTDCMLEDLVPCGESGYFQYNNYAMNLGMGPTGSYASYFWLSYYQGIRSANEIIALAGKEEDGPQKQYWMAQALAYRAMFYLDLARLYEPKENDYVTIEKHLLGYTVPKVTEETDEKQLVRNPRLLRKDMYEFILGDLKEAHAMFIEAEKGGYVSAVTRPGRHAVRGLMARALIEMAYWEEFTDSERTSILEELIACCDDVMAAFVPLSQDQWEDPATGFNKAAANSSWVWGLSLDSSMTNNLFNFTSMMCVEALFGYAAITVPGVSAGLYKAASDSDFRKHSWYHSQSGYDYRFSGDVDEGNAARAAAVDYQSLKFRPALGEVSDYSVAVAADHPLMRVEEMYFLKMEALLLKDGLSAAAGLLEQFLNDHRYMDRSYVCNAADEDTFVKEMLLHKRLEFWGEGVLIYDYKRLDQGITRNYEGTNYEKDYLFNTVGRSPQWNFCIPISELQYNVGIPEDMNNPDPTGFADSSEGE